MLPPVVGPDEVDEGRADREIVPERRVAFVAANRGWGGSEELWSATAAVLAGDGHRVTVYKSGSDDEPRLRALRDLSCEIHDLARLALVPRRMVSRFAMLSPGGAYLYEAGRLLVSLALSRRPDLVVVSQGGNHDGYPFAEVCRRLRLPYVLISQKASELDWPRDWEQQTIARVYRAARASYFVSEHNLKLTEEQLGFCPPRAQVVRNPFLVPHAPRADWPDERDGWRFACVARLNPREKGQDLLLRVLARPRWRSRPVSVTFFGDGLQRASLERMVERLGLSSVRFAGFVRDVAAIWTDHHGLILPSRCEGLPIALVEAMLSGRVAIVTDVGGSREVADDATAFVAAAATEDALDDAMERAWRARGEWRDIGARAAVRIRQLVAAEPERQFADRLVVLANQRSRSGCSA